MNDSRLTDTLRNRHVSLEPEKLVDFENRELTLRNFRVQNGNYGNYVIMDTVDENGEGHMLTTGGMTILRLLSEIDPETDLPAQVKFVRVVSGSGRKVWSIE